MSYWSDPTHSTWSNHYFESGKGDFFLAFSKEWRDLWLPPNGAHGGFQCELVDSQSGVIYGVPIYVAYERPESAKWNVQDEEYNYVDHSSLMPYWYEEHHCPCHRHTDAVIAGLDESREDFECARHRFNIKTITCDRLPGVVLYSELLGEEELEKTLKDVKMRLTCVKINAETDLTVGQDYEQIPDEQAEADDYVRVIDDSGEDYLHPRSYFNETNV